MDFLLLSISLVGIIMVLFSKRNILGSILAFSGFTIYFFVQPNHTWLVGVILLTGFVMCLFELVIPGVGILGFLGIVFLVYGLYLSNGNLVDVLLDICLSGILGATLITVLINKGYTLQFGNKIVLENVLDKGNGYSAGKDYSELLNQSGIATTTLRPVGKAIIEDVEYQVVSSGKVIEESSPIKVIAVEGNKIVVKEEDEC